MYHILTGNQRALQFPVMCNACVKLDYTDNIPDTNSNFSPDDDIAYGLWGHVGSFTFQSIITPYDINGYGVHSSRVFSDVPAGQRVLNNSALGGSKKIMPATDRVTPPSNVQSELYLPTTTAGRLQHEMMLFYNYNFQISLINDTTHNENNPAKYKIKAGIRTSSMNSMDYVTSPTVILPAYDRGFYSDAGSGGGTDGIDQYSGFDYTGRLKYKQVNTVGSGTSTLTSILCGANTRDFFGSKGQEVFVRTGNEFALLGTVASVGASNIVLNSSHSQSISAGDGLYLRAYAEPTYINKLFHISCVYDDVSKNLSIYLDSTLIVKGTISSADNFSFDGTDCYIGSNGSNATGAGSATTNKQYMGEIHEICIENINRKKIIRHTNLLPNYNNALMYLRFEEVDL